jgi:hypothetical protein
MQLRGLAFLSRRLLTLRFLCFLQLRIFGCRGPIVGFDKHVGDFVESLLYMLGSFGTCFYILNFLVFLNECLDFLHLHCPVHFHVAFVANQQNLGLRRTGVAYFVEPILRGVFERLLVSDVEDDHESVCTSIVGAGDCSEALMASSVPDLQFDLVAVEGERFEAEVNPDGRKEDLAELVVSVAYYD